MKVSDTSHTNIKFRDNSKILKMKQQVTLLLLLLTAVIVRSTDSIQHPPSTRHHLQYISKLPVTKSPEKTELADQKIEILASKEKSISLNAFDLCLCGAFATVVGDFCLHPIDTIKIMQQTATGSLTILETARQILTKSGPMGFYQGVVPYLTADGISGAIKFATFELSKVFVEARIPVSYHPAAQFVCAAGAMIACSIALVPGEVLKTRLQAGSVKNLAEGISQILKQDGFGGFFAGYYATLVRDVPYTMMELGIYENLKTMARKFRKKQDLDQTDELLAAAFTGAFTGFVTTPLDVVKTKLMMESTTSGKYAGFLDAFKSIYRTGGIDALFVGSAARVAWLLPFTTIYLGAYELAKRSLVTYKTAQRDAKE